MLFSGIDSIIIENISLKGGDESLITNKSGIKIQNAEKVLIKYVVFESISAIRINGGALFLESIVSCLITNSDFLRNNVFNDLDDRWGNGGAIYISSSKMSLISCRFEGNTAECRSFYLNILRFLSINNV